MNWCNTHHQQAQGTIMCTAHNWLAKTCQISTYNLMNIQTHYKNGDTPKITEMIIDDAAHNKAKDIRT